MFFARIHGNNGTKIPGFRNPGFLQCVVACMLRGVIILTNLSMGWPFCKRGNDNATNYIFLVELLGGEA